MSLCMKKIVLYMVLIFTASTLYADVNDNDGKVWLWEEHGVSLKFTQLTPLQSEAFFIGRGFSAENAAVVGSSCMFQGIFRNDGAKTVEYNLTEWKVIQQQNLQSQYSKQILVRNYWDKKWDLLDIPDSPKIAFRWSLIPTQQQFEPEDYNWGMISFGLQPSESFDLDVTLYLNGSKLQTTILAMECAK